MVLNTYINELHTKQGCVYLTKSIWIPDVWNGYTLLFICSTSFQLKIKEPSSFPKGTTFQQLIAQCEWSVAFLVSIVHSDNQNSEFWSDSELEEKT